MHTLYSGRTKDCIVLRKGVSISRVGKGTWVDDQGTEMPYQHGEAFLESQVQGYSDIHSSGKQTVLSRIPQVDMRKHQGESTILHQAQGFSSNVKLRPQQQGFPDMQVCVCLSTVVNGGQVKALDPSELEFQVVIRCRTWVLGTELGCSATAISPVKPSLQAPVATVQIHTGHRRLEPGIQDRLTEMDIL